MAILYEKIGFCFSSTQLFDLETLGLKTSARSLQVLVKEKIVEQNYVLGGLWVWGVVLLSIAQPAWAATTQVTAVQINPTEAGFQLNLETTQETSEETDQNSSRTGDRPQIFITNRDNVWLADLINTHLNLEEGHGFQQDNPAPGIASVVVIPLDANSIRIRVTGTSKAPTGNLLQRGSERITFAIQAIVGEQTQAPVEPSSSPTAVSPAPPSTVSPSRPTSVPPPSSVLVPNPEITITGNQTPGEESRQMSQPLQPRAIAPPVGDIAISATDTTASTIDLGTNDLVPRLVLRNAPVRDVLALLARSAGLNLAFSDPATANNDGSDVGAAATHENPENAEPRVSLDIENEPIQEVFNYVLQLSGLEANRKGRTIFVGVRLPNASRNTIVRSLRMNQVQVGVALNFLVAMGAESAVSRERLVTNVNAVAVALPEDVTTESNSARSALTQTQTTTEERLEPQRVDYQDTVPPLRGLLVLGDERTNTITLVGAANQVEIAATQLTQLDVRRRQVAVNVKVIDVDLSAIEDFSGSFSFGVNDTFVQSSAGSLSLNFNDYNNGTSDSGGSSNGNDSNAFTALLQAQVTSGNAKVLTDPTLIVQEGQTATVALTEEVATTTGKTTFSQTGDTTSFQQDEPRAAGLTLAIEVNRIDDNGFISLSVAPTITAPAGQQTNPDGSNTTLLSSRSLQSGQIRLRDNQTLILSGIIQDTDRTTITKVPILGDIPLLGALFRSTNRDDERREVIVVLKPQIIDDSDHSSFGYSYTPGREVQQLLQK